MQPEKKRPGRFDPKEVELPETIYVRDIENKVFQGIVLDVLSRIEGISLVEGGFIDSLFRNEPLEKIKGIDVEQDVKGQSVAIKVEVNISFGIPIPEKADEIQAKITEEVSRMTGLHVSLVHVIFRNIFSQNQTKQMKDFLKKDFNALSVSPSDYTDEF